MPLILVGHQLSADTHFTDITESSGVQFVHQSGKQGEFLTLEITGAGVGLLDFDNDGRLDIWLIQSGPIAARDGELPMDRLYRNISTDDELKFEDVTRSSGVVANGYGMGIATGDIDNDGDTDVFLANFASNQLYENLGGGRFRDITDSSGITGDHWSISSSFADINHDGLLDLYVGNYLDFDVASYKPCRGWSSRLSYCAPNGFEPTADQLYLNLGNGKFEDVSERAGITLKRGGAMAVVADDFDGDGNTDFYVANDGLDNLLWLNKTANTSEPRFEDEGLLSGLAVNADGIAEASMGIAVADFDHDNDPDLFVTHDVKESNTLYQNAAHGWFEDTSAKANVAAISLPFSAFGTRWLDVDNDGDMDLFIVNGAVTVIESQLAAGIDPPLRQRNLLLLNDGSGRFTAPLDSSALDVEEVGRGAAFGDLDNDGDTDVIVTNNHGVARLYRNDSASMNWLGLRLTGSNRQSQGALLWLAGSSERKRVATDGSYASAHDPRVLFGLGADAKSKSVKVRWPNSEEETFGPLKANQYHEIRYGEGQIVPVSQ